MGIRKEPRVALPNPALPHLAKPSRTVLCPTTPCQAKPDLTPPRLATPDRTAPCPAAPCHAEPCRTSPNPAAPCHTIPRHAKPSHAPPCRAKLHLATPGRAEPYHVESKSFLSIHELRVWVGDMEERIRKKPCLASLRLGSPRLALHCQGEPDRAQPYTGSPRFLFLRYCSDLSLILRAQLDSSGPLRRRKSVTRNLTCKRVSKMIIETIKPYAVEFHSMVQIIPC
jgi:hypothetical protein